MRSHRKHGRTSLRGLLLRQIVVAVVTVTAVVVKLLRILRLLLLLQVLMLLLLLLLLLNLQHHLLLILQEGQVLLLQHFHLGRKHGIVPFQFGLVAIELIHRLLQFREQVLAPLS